MSDLDSLKAELLKLADALYQAGRADKSREIVAQLQGAGSAQKQPSKRRGRPPSTNVSGPSVVRAWLIQHGKGKARELVEVMRQTPELAHHFKDNPQWGHTTLGRMRHRGYLSKDGKFYRLNPEKDQPHLRLVAPA
jgi:hypothetical protein